MNDLLALGSMKALDLAGRRIPEDVAVVGFDDVEDGMFSRPSLTTIAPDKRRIAQSAVSLLIGWLTGERTGPGELVRPPYRLLARASTTGREPREMTAVRP